MASRQLKLIGILVGFTDMEGNVYHAELNFPLESTVHSTVRGMEGCVAALYEAARVKWADAVQQQEAKATAPAGVVQ